MIVITKYSKTQYSEMLKIFEALWSKYIVNANVIMQSAMGNENEALMFTYYPFTEYFCQEVHPIILNHFVDGEFTFKIDYFPNKVTNLYLCPIKVATFNNIPFMRLIKRADGSGYDLGGIDGTLLRVLSQKMNFTVEIIDYPDLWGLIRSDGSVSGATEAVVNNEVNFTMGFYITTPRRNAAMQESYNYYSSYLVWVIPSGHQLSGFEKLFKPFKYIIWSCVSSIIVVSMLVIFFLKFKSKVAQRFVYGTKNYSPCLNVFNVFFGGSLINIPKRNFARTILCIFILYCLIIRSTYQGALFKFLQSDNRKPEVIITL